MNIKTFSIKIGLIVILWWIAYLFLYNFVKEYNKAYWENNLAVNAMQKFISQKDENAYLESNKILNNIDNKHFIEKDYNKTLLNSMKVNNDINKTKDELNALLKKVCYKKNTLKNNLSLDEKNLCARGYYNLGKIFISLAAKDIKNKDFYFKNAINSFDLSNKIVVNQKIKDNFEIIRKIIAEEKDPFQSEYDNFITAENQDGNLLNENNHKKDTEEKEELNSNLRNDDETQQFEHKINNENQWKPTWSLYGEFTGQKTDEIKDNDKDGSDNNDLLREQKAGNARMEGEGLWNRKENEYGDENPYYENEKKKNQEKQLDTFFSNTEIEMEKKGKKIDAYYIYNLIKDEIKYKRKF